MVLRFASPSRFASVICRPDIISCRFVNCLGMLLVEPKALQLLLVLGAVGPISAMMSGRTMILLFVCYSMVIPGTIHCSSMLLAASK